MNPITRHIPNCITCLNIASGFLAIVFASWDLEVVGGLPAYQWAFIFIGIAAVADFLDGLSARALRAYSDVGRELDSLCDVVSFGVAPAILVFHALRDSLAPDWQWIGWMAVLIPVGGALRLARFNIDTRQATTFIGLPIPANAIFWVGFSAHAFSRLDAFSPWLCMALLLLVPYLMVSPWQLFSLKFKNFSWRDNSWRYLLILSTGVCVFVLGVYGLMWAMIIYFLMGYMATRRK